MRKQWGFWAERLSEEILRDLYEVRGLSISQVAKRIGCSIRTVQHHLAKHGIRSRPSGGKPKIRQLSDDELIGGYYQAGSVTALAKRLRVTRTTLAHEFIRRGLKARRLAKVPPSYRARKTPQDQLDELRESGEIQDYEIQVFEESTLPNRPRYAAKGVMTLRDGSRYETDYSASGSEKLAAREAAERLLDRYRKGR